MIMMPFSYIEIIFQIKNSGDVNYVNNNDKISANTKSRNSSLTNIESQKPLPVSSLSGFRPGDILAKAVSNVRFVSLNINRIFQFNPTNYKLL